MSSRSLKVRLLLSRLLMSAIPFAVAVVAYPHYPSVASGIVICGLVAFLFLVLPALSTIGLSVTVPGRMVSRGTSDKGPPSFEAKDLGDLVRFTAQDEAISRLPADGRWRLCLSLRIENTGTAPIEVYDIRFHVYCNDTGPPLMAIGVTDSVEVTESNSIMDSGQTFVVGAGSERTFELNPTVTREPASKGFVIIFGAFAFYVVGDPPNRTTARIPCDSVFCCQNDHLAKMNCGNIGLYKRKHEKGLSGSILVAVCEDALNKQLAAASAIGGQP